MFLLAGVAMAECGAEAPLLQLGDRAWSVSTGTWAEPIAIVACTDGFAFDVTYEGRPVGVVFAGQATQTTFDPDGSLAAALDRELGVAAGTGAWTVPVDVVWSTGAAALSAWLPLRVDGTGSVGVDLPDMETVMVVSHRDLAAARTAAAAALRDRSAALSGSGYPLTSMLTARPSGWRLIEARTALPIGRSRPPGPVRPTRGSPRSKRTRWWTVGGASPPSRRAPATWRGLAARDWRLTSGRWSSGPSPRSPTASGCSARRRPTLPGRWSAPTARSPTRRR